MTERGREQWKDSVGGTDADSLIQRMLDRLSGEVPGISRDLAMVDPALRLLLRCLATELQDVYQEIDATRESAVYNFARRLMVAPRGPRPAETVIQFHTDQPSVMVGPDAAAVCTVPSIDNETKRPTEIPLEFRPGSDTLLGEYRVAATFRLSTEGSASLELDGASSAQRWTTARPNRPVLSVCVEPRSEEFAEGNVRLFLEGPAQAASRVLWGAWSVGPEMREPRGDVAGEEDLVGGYDLRFVRFFVRAGSPGPPPPCVDEIKRHLPEFPGPRWWITVEPHGAHDEDLESVRLLADCVPAQNLSLGSQRFVVPDLPLQELVLEARVDELVDVVEIVDTDVGHAYRRVDRFQDATAAYTYFVRESQERPERAAVYLRKPIRGVVRCDTLVSFTTSHGPLANGLAPGSLDRLLRPISGVRGVRNVVPTTGGMDARPIGGEAESLLRRLRHRDRAVTGSDFRDLAVRFGAPVVRDATVRSSVMITPGGTRRCVRVVLELDDAAVETADSPGFREALCSRLEQLLGRRVPIGMAVEVVLDEPHEAAR